jgi:hypothetical protein
LADFNPSANGNAMTGVRFLPVLVLIPVSIGMGCRDDEPSGLGELAIVKPGAPTPKFLTESDISLVAPKNRSRFGVGDPIPCTVEFDTSAGQKMPIGVAFHLSQGDKIIDSCEATIEEGGGPSDRPRFIGRLKAPERPGRYGVKAEVVDAVIVRSVDSEAGTATSRTLNSPEAGIEVRQ